QYWYSRFLMPEIPSQYFLWAGLWAGALSLSSGASRLGALSGLAVGVAGLMRLDVLIHVAAGLALWKAFAPRHSWPAGRGFATAWPDFATDLAWLRIYACWPIALAAVIGVPCWLRRARNSAERFALVFALVATAQLFYYPPVSPQPLWAIRRFLRIAFPLLAIGAGLALSPLAARGRWLLSVAGLALILSFGPRLAFKYRQPAYQDTMAYVRSIGALIPRGAVIVGDPAF